MPRGDALAFLAEATEILSSSLDYQATLRRIAALAVPHFADWCSITIIDAETEEPSLGIVRHVDPQKLLLAEQLQHELRMADLPNSDAQVIESGKTIYVPKITKKMIREGIANETIRDMAESLGLRSYICAPLSVRNKILGAITFVWAESGHIYSPEDVTLIERLARAAAISIDNAQLYEEAQAEIQGRKEAEQQVRVLNRELKMRILERTSELEEANKALEEYQQELEQRVEDRTLQITEAQASLSKRAQQQEMIARLGQIALSTTELGELANEVCMLLSTTMDVDYTKLMRLENERKRFLLYAGTGWVPGLVGAHVIAADLTTQSGYTLESNQPVIVRDLKKETRFRGPSILHEHNVTSGASVIVAAHGQPWGVLSIHTRKLRAFGQDDINFLQSVGNVISLFLERQLAEETIRHQAFHDALTGLPNRALLEDRLEVELGRAKKNGTNLGILFLDLDRFKNINDTLGHSIGDIVLREAANRLQACLRPGDTLARFGGDEFLLIMPEIKSTRSIERMTRSIFKALTPPFQVSGQELHINTSIGISHYPFDGENVDTLLKNADTALYSAKELGRNGYRMYTETMNLDSSLQLTLENDMRRALENNQFELWYQPIVDINANKIVSAEALIRWKHPKHGYIFPSDFIPIAEETGLIVPLGEWIFRTAAEQYLEWESKLRRNFRIALNLSVRQLEREAMVSRFQRIQKEVGLKPNVLEIEITESMAMRNVELTIEKLQALLEIGISATIDDFGTGHSSLNYLKQLPVNKLKIDRSFIRNCINDVQDAAIIKAITSLAHSLNLRVVAEGVEHKDQLAFLLALGCEQAQGYLLGKPQPALEFAKLITD